MELGIARYRAALDADGNTAVPAGMQLIRAAMEPTIKAIEEWLEETGKGLAARSASLYHFINQLKPEQTSWIVAHATLNMLHERPSLARVATALCINMESAINVDAIIEAQPKLGAKLAKQLERKKGASSRALFIRKGGALADVTVVQWDDATRVRVGTLLVELFAASTGLVAVELTKLRGAKTGHVVRPTESCRVWLEESHARCELLSPLRLPMVCKPRDWTNPFNGGYLTHELRQPLVKTRNKGYLQTLREHEMPWVYGSVNLLQGTEWAVNKPIYDIIKQLWEARSVMGDLPQRREGKDVELPKQPWGDDEEPSKEALHAWKVDAARAYEADAKAESKRAQLIQKLWVAEMMMDRGNKFHYVYNLDWRGRMYPVGPALTPQGDDVAKAMIQFAQSSRLGEDGAYWLAVHGANTFGVDKVSFEDRINWVSENAEMILACGEDPYVNRGWTEADSPFCFLAFCMEYIELQQWVDRGQEEADFASSLPVAFDGSCNGLQNFSAMLLDPVGGKATGLVPSEKPADIYTEVARAAQAIIDKDAAEGHEVAPRWVGGMTRKLAKRNTMTVPYGVTRRGMRDQLYKELDTSAPEHRALDADYLAGCNYEAIGNVVVAARLAMDWLRDTAKAAASNELPVRWVTPSGLLVVQDYRQDEGQMVDFKVLGRRYQLMLQKTGDKLSSRKQALGISPNFVHSLDAAHLMRTVLFCAQDGMVDFAMIHDSYGVHAGNASRLRDNLREAFVAQYSQPVLGNFRNEILEQLPPEMHGEVPPIPPMGTLDLEQVRQSEYFFA